VECSGISGVATVNLLLPHKNASLTDLIGRKKSSLRKASPYRIPIRPQQIVTIHFETAAALPVPGPIKAWDSFVPQNKLAALHSYDRNLKGHPPFGV
jgi:hypothetical protein